MQWEGSRWASGAEASGRGGTEGQAGEQEENRGQELEGTALPDPRQAQLDMISAGLEDVQRNLRQAQLERIAEGLETVQRDIQRVAETCVGEDGEDEEDEGDEG